jgi:hypothetical protein
MDRKHKRPKKLIADSTELMMTQITIDCSYCRSEKMITAEFSVCDSAPPTLAEINVVFDSIGPGVGDSKELLQLALTPRQAKEFIWALEKMVKVTKTIRMKDSEDKI